MPTSSSACSSRNPKWREEMEARFLDRLRVNAAMEAAPDPGNIIAFLLQQGVGEATDVLLIDESLCVRCDNCEKACADVHDGTSRLDREAGPTFAEIHVPTSCRHCEHPHCMKDCPPDAIHRSPNGEVFVNDSCIGCGNCEKNCPYGVIQLAPVDPKRRRPSLWSWLVLGRGAGAGARAQAQGQGHPEEGGEVRHVQGPARGRGVRARLPDRGGHPREPGRVPRLRGDLGGVTGGGRRAPAPAGASASPRR